MLLEAWPRPPLLARLSPARPTAASRGRSSLQRRRRRRPSKPRLSFASTRRARSTPSTTRRIAFLLPRCRTPWVPSNISSRARPAPPLCRPSHPCRASRARFPRAAGQRPSSLLRSGKSKKSGKHSARERPRRRWNARGRRCRKKNAGKMSNGASKRRGRKRGNVSRSPRRPRRRRARRGKLPSRKPSKPERRLRPNEPNPTVLPTTACHGPNRARRARRHGSILPCNAPRTNPTGWSTRYCLTRLRRLPSGRFRPKETRRARGPGSRGTAHLINTRRRRECA